MLKVIGFWIRDLDDDSWPAPQECAGTWPAPLRGRIVDYLQAGLMFRGYFGQSWCRFGCESLPGSRDLTDGMWLWPEGLPHYVRHHDVILPDEFVAHVVSGATPQRPDRAERVDQAFWCRWAAARRWPDFRQRLCKARSAATQRVVAVDAAYFERLGRTHGLSNEKCQWWNCSDRALTGMAICAKHSCGGQGLPSARIPLKELKRCLDECSWTQGP